jgi:hypothetical protein
MRVPVVWVLKAKMKWVMPLKIIAQPKKRVITIPEIEGMRMANSPVTMSRTLRAMDQLTALGAKSESAAGVVLIVSSKRGRDESARWAEDSTSGFAVGMFCAVNISR